MIHDGKNNAKATPFHFLSTAITVAGCTSPDHPTEFAGNHHHLTTNTDPFSFMDLASHRHDITIDAGAAIDSSNTPRP
jgi:hypothetical protein